MLASGDIFLRTYALSMIKLYYPSDRKDHSYGEAFSRPEVCKGERTRRTLNWKLLAGESRTINYCPSNTAPLLVMLSI